MFKITGRALYYHFFPGQSIAAVNASDHFDLPNGLDQANAKLTQMKMNHAAWEKINEHVVGYSIGAEVLPSFFRPVGHQFTSPYLVCIKHISAGEEILTKYRNDFETRGHGSATLVIQTVCSLLVYCKVVTKVFQTSCRYFRVFIVVKIYRLPRHRRQRLLQRSRLQFKLYAHC